MENQNQNQEQQPQQPQMIEQPQQPQMIEVALHELYCSQLRGQRDKALNEAATNATQAEVYRREAVALQKELDELKGKKTEAEPKTKEASITAVPDAEKKSG